MDDFEFNPIGEEADGGELENEDQREDIQDEEGSEGSGAGEGADVKAAEDAARQEAERARKFNASMKAARLAGEKAAEERLSKAHSQRVANMRLPNPEKPGEYFSTLEEMEEYSKKYRLSQAEQRAKREKRSVDEIIEEDENRAFITAQRKAAAAAEKAPAKEDRSSTLASHIKEMRERYPDVDIVKLEQNTSFRRFAGSRFGRESLADLYEAYSELMGSAAEAAAVKAKSKTERATGGSTGRSSGTLSTAQKAALQRWNENNPDMKMTEKEFLERG
ncbi:MAG: hypothetical protein IJY96_05295 [Oscillospiraceae bacterium]|nr:hypothetical protein [Oscillospiraceae bacterium]